MIPSSPHPFLGFLLLLLSAHALPAAVDISNMAAPSPAAETPTLGSDQAEGWPLTMTKNDWEVRLYYPRAESLNGDILTARAVFSISHFDSDGNTAAAPSFGVVWLSAHADTDRDSRTMTLSGQTVTKVLLTNSNDQDKAQISELISNALRGLDPVISLDRVMTALQQAQIAHAQAQKLATTPPPIIVAHQPSMLLLLDGEPHGVPIENSGFERIANTPFMLARDSSSKAYWLYYGSRWYNAATLEGQWRVVDQAPDQVAALVPKLQGFQPQGAPEPIGNPQSIVVSLKPTELICFDGQPTYEPVPGGGLEAATNTNRDVFLDPASKLQYVLLSGRWYSSPNVDQGPWTYVPANALPADFSHIPADSKFADVRAHVAGTTEADEAVMDSQIPQTAAVRRDATITVSYDGDPKFQPVTGTKLSYSLNSADEVIEVSPTSYYCCYQGAWYTATSPLGPWMVATSMPPDLDAVPPDSPIYNTRYVYVYESTPEYCYVGYYPGYTGCYAYEGSVVWGTGYRYDGWWGHHYYSRPCTWGLGMSYNPWTCLWGSDIHARFGGPTGFWAFGVHGTGPGWWGPIGYRPAYIHSAPPDAGVIAFERSHIPEEFRGRIGGASSNVIYRRPENSVRMIASPQMTHVSTGPAMRPGLRSNPGNDRVISGANGEVYRKQGETWQRWQEHGWNNLPTEHRSTPAPLGTGAEPRPRVSTPIDEPRPRVKEILREGPRQSAPGEAIHRSFPAPHFEDLERENAIQDRSYQRSYQFQQSHSSTTPLRSFRDSRPARPSVPPPLRTR